MKRYLLPVFLLFGAMNIRAQVASDALRYSYLQPGGTARYLGAGGAFGALGAEFSTLSENPAGLAMFRSNELVVTPSLLFSKTDAQLPGNLSDVERKSNFGFDNVGLIFNTTPANEHWKTFNVGIGLNRMNNYSQSVYYSGTANGSIMNYFAADAQQTFTGGGNEDNLYPYGSRLAWDANAIYLQNGVLTSDFDNTPNPSLQREHTVTTYGRMNELVLSFAGNYNEKLMIGGTIGVPFVNYHLDGEYSEKDPGGALDGNVQYFDKLSYTDYLHTDGVGINAKLGFIYKVNQMFRIGAAFHTPTVFKLTDTYNNSFTYAYEDGSGAHSNTATQPDDGISDYRLHTPWRAIGSASVLFNKFGFLSADVEFVDYTANRFVLTADVNNLDNKTYERQLNNEIQQMYKQAVNIRLGGELALDNFRIRGGLDLNGKPGKNDTGFNTGYTAGVGIRSESFYIDLGYRITTGQGMVIPYEGSVAANTDVTVSDILLTFGLKF